MRFYLVALEGFVTGAHARVDWAESWKLTSVAPEAWDALKPELHKTCEHTTDLIKGSNRWDEDELSGAFSVLVHSAYHLGTMRQLLNALS